MNSNDLHCKVIPFIFFSKQRYVMTCEDKLERSRSLNFTQIKICYSLNKRSKSVQQEVKKLNKQNIGRKKKGNERKKNGNKWGEKSGRQKYRTETAQKKDRKSREKMIKKPGKFKISQETYENEGQSL